jgi:hypothetical protein
MDQIYSLLDIAASKHRFSPAEKEAAAECFEEMYALLETHHNPPGFRLATGEIAKGATGRTALNAYFLLLGRLALGKDYARHDKRFTYWNMRLEYGIMRSNFIGQAERGLYCCPTCTLSVFPLYCISAFDRFDSDLLKQNVVEAYTKKAWRFGSNYSKTYADWVMQFA